MNYTQIRLFLYHKYHQQITSPLIKKFFFVLMISFLFCFLLRFVLFFICLCSVKSVKIWILDKSRFLIERRRLPLSITEFHTTTYVKNTLFNKPEVCLFVLTGSNPDFHTNLSWRIEHRRFGTHTKIRSLEQKKRILDLEAAVLGSFALCFFFLFRHNNCQQIYH